MPRLGLLAPWLLATFAPLLAHAMDPVAPAPSPAASATAAPARTAPPATTAATTTAPPATTTAPGSAPMAPPPTTATPGTPAPYPYPYPYPPPSGQYPPANGQYGSTPPGAYPYPWWSTPATRPPEPPTTTVTERYFKPILVSDVLSTALLVVGLTRDNSAMISFGVVSFLVVPPVIHFAENNRVGIGFASFGIRLGIPLVTALTLAVVCEDNNRCDTGNAALTGMVIGALGASALDQGIFARRSVVVRTGSAPSIVPMLAPRREGGAQLGLGGTF